jgi:hypothetical protein
MDNSKTTNGTETIDVLKSIEKTEIHELKKHKHISLRFINLLFKNFCYIPTTGQLLVYRKFSTNNGMDLDGDIINATSKNPFKSKYRYELCVDVLHKYFVIVRKVRIHM